MTPSMIATE